MSNLIPFPVHRLIVVRGLPGTGVTTLARKIAQEGGGLLVAMDTPSDKHDYFSTWRKSVALIDTLNVAQTAFNGRHKLVVVDRHHLRHWEMRSLVAAGVNAGYQVTFEQAAAPWAGDDTECAKHSTFDLRPQDVAVLRKTWQEDGTVDQILVSKNTRDEAIEALRSGARPMGEAPIAWLLRQGYL